MPTNQLTDKGAPERVMTTKLTPEQLAEILGREARSRYALVPTKHLRSAVWEGESLVVSFDREELIEALVERLTAAATTPALVEAPRFGSAEGQVAVAEDFDKPMELVEVPAGTEGETK